MASKIVSVDAGSPAARAGLAAGETLLQIDGVAIRDVLDYKFYSYDAALTLQVMEADEKTLREVHVRKREGEPLGLNFEHYLMDGMKQCSNKCVFCFIDQLPRGMRKTLYVKDDDARMSFLMGNYISMTNLSEADVDRILRMHISPVNISVQTTNPELRVKMLRNPRAGEALKIMNRFAEGGIQMNCQLVVCKGLNDGEELRRSLRDLKALYPAVNTISVVPFGMTRIVKTCIRLSRLIRRLLRPALILSGRLRKRVCANSARGWSGVGMSCTSRPSVRCRTPNITRISRSLKTVSVCCRCSWRSSGSRCRITKAVPRVRLRSRPARLLHRQWRFCLTKRRQNAII